MVLGFKRRSSATIASITGDVEVVQPNAADLNATVVQATHGNLNADVWSAGDTISQIPTITAGAYIANDNVGGLLTFANAARENGGGGVIKGVQIVDDAGQDAELELWLFDQTFTQGADNAPWSPSEADLENIVCIITTLDGRYYAAGANQSVADIEVARRFDLIAAGTSLFGRLVTRGAPTYTATDDLTVKVALLQD